ncbi:hypothetical protein CSKR_106318 [Clonorchis sinensis]|uniref:Uncharacterized protein n=1 Tax=Clonorchis sinensis TaxID=79923 RepID=A0A3R7H422_CLOSI|nr:hypothetical protein CSKR_106318 [Clonorchis sinensis]
MSGTNCKGTLWRNLISWNCTLGPSVQTPWQTWCACLRQALVDQFALNVVSAGSVGKLHSPPDTPDCKVLAHPVFKNCTRQKSGGEIQKWFGNTRHRLARRTPPDQLAVCFVFTLKNSSVVADMGIRMLKRVSSLFHRSVLNQAVGVVTLDLPSSD